MPFFIATRGNTDPVVKAMLGELVPPSIVGLAIPPEDMQRFEQPSIFLQGPRQGTFARIGVELLHEEGGGHPAQPDGAGNAQHLLPPVQNARSADAPPDMGLEPDATMLRDAI
jgi:hypothetical protein